MHYKTKRAVTHDGLFYPDEVMSSALLRYFLYNYFIVTRTGNIGSINGADIVINIGGIYDPSKMRFDYHQFDQKSPDYGKSSAGLVAEYLIGRGFLLSKELLELIRGIDYHVCGIKNSKGLFIKVISDMNDPYLNPKLQDQYFEIAIDFTLEIIARLMGEYVYRSNITTNWIVHHVHRNKIYNKITCRNRSIKIKREQQKIVDRSKVFTIKGIDLVLLPKGTMFVPAGMFKTKADIVIQYNKRQNLWDVQVVLCRQTSFIVRPYLIEDHKLTSVFIDICGFAGKYKEKGGTIAFTVNGKGKLFVKVGEKRETI